MAASVTFNSAGTVAGIPVAAEATFTTSGDDLSLSLRNIAPSNVGIDSPTSTLTGVFFYLPSTITLTPWSANVAAGSIINAAACLTGACGATTTDVGGEFGYQQGAFASGANRGVASAGYVTTGLSGNIGNFANNGVAGGLAGINLADPVSLDGINFGIISSAAGFSPNGGLASVPLIRDTVTFVFHGASLVDLAQLSIVRFQYGTALSEPYLTSDLTPVPLPAAALLLGLGLVGLGGFARRR